MNIQHPARISHHVRFLLAACTLLLGALFITACVSQSDHALNHAIDAAVTPVMQQHRIPGFAVGVVQADRTTTRCYGVISLNSTTPVGTDTLFEVGSVSKTFTALLGAHAVVQGRVSLDDPVHTHLPRLHGSPIGGATLLQLATYSSGCTALQVPSTFTEQTLLNDLTQLTPTHPPSTHRIYSNASIGLFGRACATAAGRDFADMMTTDILRPLALHDTHLTVPTEVMARYAVGTNPQDQPTRVTPGVLDDEAYGIKATVADMCRYLQVQSATPAHTTLANAIQLTHTGHFTVGPMTQALGWESYPYPTSLHDLLAGNAPAVIFEPNPTHPADTTSCERLFNKTGSTNGFAAYALFIPSKRIGIVLLANRSFPIADRITIAHTILQSLDDRLTTTPPHASQHNHTPDSSPSIKPSVP